MLLQQFIYHAILNIAQHSEALDSTVSTMRCYVAVPLSAHCTDVLLTTDIWWLPPSHEHSAAKLRDSLGGSS